MHVQFEMMLGKSDKMRRKKKPMKWQRKKKCHTGNEMKVNRLVLESQSRATTKLNLVHLLKIRQDLMKMVKCWEKIRRRHRRRRIFGYNRPLLFGDFVASSQLMMKMLEQFKGSTLSI